MAARLGCVFEEGDALHPPANIAKMRSGVPLDDADRTPWLDAVARWIARQEGNGADGVISCSALKRSYRDWLRRAGADRLGFVLPDVDQHTLAARVAGRHDHFMPASLLGAQLDTLERPDASERRWWSMGPRRSSATSTSSWTGWTRGADMLDTREQLFQRMNA